MAKKKTKKAAKKKAKKKAPAKNAPRKFGPTMAACGNYPYVIELIAWCKAKLKTWTPGADVSGDPARCPACKTAGSLKYGASGYNGHVWAKCSKRGCIDVIE